MATNVFYDNVMSTAKLAEFSAEQSVETEILLADYDAPVFKVIKTTMEHSVTQKYVTKNKLVLEGFIKLCIYYQPPEGEKLNVITQRIPFQKQHDIQTEHNDLSYIKVEGSCQYVNTRPQNPTRIDVRGAYLFTVRLYGTNEYKALTAASGKTVCCHSENLEFFSLSGHNIRQFTIEDELDIEELSGKILRVNPVTQPAAVSSYSDKITAKGEIAADFYYTVSDSYEIKKYTHTFLYNQVIDVNGVRENHIAYADIAVTNVAVSFNSENKKYIAAVTVQIDATAFAKQQVIAVTDAFSRSFECEKQENTVLTDTNIYQVDKTLSVKLSSKQDRDTEIKHVVFELSPVKSYYEINKMTVKAKLMAHIITLNSQYEYECSTVSEDIVLQWLENCSQHDEISVALSVAGYTLNQSSEQSDISVTLSARGFVIEKQPVKLLENFEEKTDSPIEKKEEALIIYYAQKGEKIFAIAKMHCASPEDIMAENDLQSDVITQPQMIFIPAFEG